ncbi:MAG: hypothetical protein GF384_05680 [Elusimicrobia bacterium]|nr:hypothetical protein [Elusimicrobiota bacterium]MBD3412255.1 hypothetical protein [Elusimicrobiota bacterium]
MNLRISDDGHSVLLDNKIIYTSKEYEMSKRFFGTINGKIIIRLFRDNNNIICIDKDGTLIWEVEDTTEDHRDPYQAFDIRNNFIFASVTLANVKIDPHTGKILEQTYAK